jgi:RluA family pseudouridine synthase
VSGWIAHGTKDFFVVNKPAGILAQKDKSGAEDLADRLKKDLERRGEKVPFLAPVHRLDRNTSGLILLARSPVAAKALTDVIRQGRLEKTYLAVVKGDPGESGTYDFPLKKDERTNQVTVSGSGSEALTEFQRIRKMGSTSLVEVRLHTGRPHQIRAHFAAAGHCLLGDRKYGKKPWSEIFSRPALHSYRLVVPEVKGRWERLQVEAPLPADMRELLSKLGGGA